MRGRLSNLYYRQLFDYNSKLVKEIMEHVPLSSLERVIEFGAGSGFFTIPLMSNIMDRVDEYIIMDHFPGPYVKDKQMLLRRIKEAGFWDKVNLKEVPVWEMKGEFEDIDLIIGHDVFCDLNMTQVRKTLKASRGSMSDEGTFIHSGLSPDARTRAERLLIKLDGCSSSPLVDDNWFSPGSEFLYVASKGAGFSSVKVHDVKIPLRMSGDKARAMIKNWRIPNHVLSRYEKEIDEVGIEFPGEHILVCRP
ncbi:MAG: hypothetical protein ACMUIE_06375 [Thermoplasmatota archaeon]